MQLPVLRRHQQLLGTPPSRPSPSHSVLAKSGSAHALRARKCSDGHTRLHKVSASVICSRKVITFSCLQDGSQHADIDAVIYCTGYCYSYPWLQSTGLLQTEDMRVHPLYQHIFPPDTAPSLSFIGLLWKSLRNPQFEFQVSNTLASRLGC